MLYCRMYGFPERYRLVYQLPGQEENKTLDLQPASIEAVRAQVFHIPRLEFEIVPEKKTMILTIQSFGYYDRVPFFRAFVDSAFDALWENQIKNLILDLRENDGGDPFCAVPLFAHLASESVPYFARPYGKYAEFAKPIPLAENRFTGRLFTLVDGRSFSTTGHFCSLLKHHGIGRFVGSETGSSFTCNAATREITLPNSRLLLYVPRSSFAAAVSNMDKRSGIQPDFPVEQTRSDLLAGRDTVLDYAISLTEKQEIDPTAP